MGILGTPSGYFDLHNSDVFVGSLISKPDVAKILDVGEEDLKTIPFAEYSGKRFIDERVLQKLWYDGMIPNAPSSKVGSAKVSLDEMILKALATIAFPGATIETQIPWGRKRVDFRISVGGVTKLIEFCGPQHFAPSQYDSAPKGPVERKSAIELEFGEECIIWPYWIQRCVSNIRAIFDSETKGFGALWSTNIHFGSFTLSDASKVIEEINKRFRANRPDGCGYFYGPCTEGRMNPEHPIIRKIASGKMDKSLLLPRGHDDPAKWLPVSLISNDQ